MEVVERDTVWVLEGLFSEDFLECFKQWKRTNVLLQMESIMKLIGYLLQSLDSNEISDYSLWKAAAETSRAILVPPERRKDCNWSSTIHKKNKLTQNLFFFVTNFFL